MKALFPKWRLEVRWADAEERVHRFVRAYAVLIVLPNLIMFCWWSNLYYEDQWVWFWSKHWTNETCIDDLGLEDSSLYLCTDRLTCKKLARSSCFKKTWRRPRDRNQRIEGSLFAAWFLYLLVFGPSATILGRSLVAKPFERLKTALVSVLPIVSGFVFYDTLCFSAANKERHGLWRRDEPFTQNAIWISRLWVGVVLLFVAAGGLYGAVGLALLARFCCLTTYNDESTREWFTTDVSSDLLRRYKALKAPFLTLKFSLGIIHAILLASSMFAAAAIFAAFILAVLLAIPVLSLVQFARTRFHHPALRLGAILQGDLTLFWPRRPRTPFADFESLEAFMQAKALCTLAFLALTCVPPGILDLDALNLVRVETHQSDSTPTHDSSEC